MKTAEQRVDEICDFLRREGYVALSAIPRHYILCHMEDAMSDSAHDIQECRKRVREANDAASMAGGPNYGW